MNILTLTGLAAATALVAGAASAAEASAPANDWTVYASGGYTYSHASVNSTDLDVGAITGRIGARYQRYLGIEAEGSFGVADDKINNGLTVKLDNQYAAYAVGFLPVSPNVDLLARIGYGHAELKASGSSGGGKAEGDTWNVGVGAQYHFDAHSAVRLEYTRLSSTESNGADFDTGTLSYVYKF